MVSQANSLESRKRKKTADMADSPPKRVTRARAKVSEEPETSAKTTIITTASARLATTTKGPEKAVKPTASIKRNTRAEVVEPLRDTAPQEDSKAAASEPPKTRGRTRRTAKDTTEALPLVEVPSSNRVRKPKADKAAEEIVLPTSKPKSRAKKITEKEPVPADEAIPKLSEQPRRTRVTRARATAPKEKVVTQSITMAPASRKRVTFQERSLDDKENIADVQATSKKAQTKATGLNAKPVRPAVSRGSVRGKKATVSTGKLETSQPLSPKKVTQMAKSSSVSSEDELSTERLPIEVLLRSPVKPPVSPQKEQSMTVVTRLDTATILASPNKLSTSAILSPPRRPPTTPFKDVLKDAPRRALFENTALEATPARPQSLLKQQPKKVNLTVTANTPMFAPLQTPLKSSLFASPARRPMTTFKPRSARSPSATAPATVGRTTSQRVAVDNHPEFNLSSLLTKSLNTDRSFDEPAKVHNMTAVQEEPVEATEDTRVEVGTADQVTPCKQVTFKTPSTLALPAMTPSPESTNSQQIDAMEGVEGHLTEVTDETSNEAQNKISTTPPNEPNLEAINPFSLALPAYRQFADDSDSEDELQSAQAVAFGSIFTRANRLRTDGTPTPAIPVSTPNSVLSHRAMQWNLNDGVGSEQLQTVKNAIDISFTPLANQLNSWMASSPEKLAQREQQEHPHGIFSPVIRSTFNQPEECPLSTPQAQPNFFNEQMLVQEQVAAQSDGTERLEHLDEANATEASQGSFEEYGDENAVPTENVVPSENIIPIDPQLLGPRLAPRPAPGPETCTPAKVFQSFPGEIRTVSKVPLRPEGADSPLKVPKKRSRSVSGPLMDMKDFMRPGIQRGVTVISYSSEGSTDAQQGFESIEAPATPLPCTAANIALPTMPLMGGWQTPYTTPGRTVRKGADAQILRGAVVLVDVHTTEGADASGIFVELLTSMGAKCVKQWTWNPRASSGKALEAGDSDRSMSASIPGGKVGITHVVYKDGGKRTMEKVRESKGLVLCVGVGWVLDCERENRWVDESDYAIDTAIIPRGGSRRRKSMEPKALAHLNGTLIPAETPSRQVSLDLSPTKEFLNLSSPVSRRQSILPSTPAPQAPQAEIPNYGDGVSSWGSPTTPYGQQIGLALVQQTCPPKQTMQPLFPLGGQDQNDEIIRQRLILARRKSLQWAPKVGSPLGRAMSYGKEMDV